MLLNYEIWLSIYENEYVSQIVELVSTLIDK